MYFLAAALPVIEKIDKTVIKNIIKLPISEACFDELGLADRSKNKPLKALHPKLDFAGKNPKGKGWP